MLKSFYKKMRKELLSKKAILLLVGMIVLGYYPVHGQLADSPWPAFLHDAQHTSRSPYVGSQEGKLQWRFKTIGDISSSPAIGAEGTIYVGDNFSVKISNYIYLEFGFLYAVNPNGTLKWFSPIGSVSYSSPAIASDGTIYILSLPELLLLPISKGYLYAINSKGKIKWRREIGLLSVFSSPIIAKDGTIYVGSGNGYFYAFNPDGSVKWKYRTLNFITTSPALDEEGNIYIGSYSQFYSVNPDGTLRWTFDVAPFWVTSSASIAQDGTIYVGCSMLFNDTGVLCALNPDGTLKWQFTLQFNMPLFITTSPVLDSDGTIYMGDDEYFYALNPDGSLKWHYKTEGRMQSSPAVDGDSSVYVCTATGINLKLLVLEIGSIYAFNNDGILKWQYKNFYGGPSSPAIAEDGTIYVGSRKGHLYSIGENSCPLTLLLEDDSPSLSVFREFRDEVLTESTLSNYISLYYQYASEISDLILSDPGLKSLAKEVLEKLTPEIQLFLDGEEVLLSVDLVKDIESLLDELAIKASPKLKAEIKKVKREISEGDLFKQLGVGVYKQINDLF